MLGDDWLTAGWLRMEMSGQVGADPDHRGTVTSRHHCRHCEPGQPAFDIACSNCGDGPILAGPLAEQVKNGDLTEPVQRWLTAAGWTVTLDL
ncbi:MULTISPECIES: hypothetical protein [unclassified Rhodococcus (in: high G+C Gram-positive bacteria)]|uniref:hypothetical protein n=1 Tax=unclassified Rhodococcus (in: high G+C Gram-positive bacteria) TaxID=192944 RepID=UPI0002A3ECC6|nr:MULTISPECIES: hypothetical protein [unclassified Rhodococcus (in: high G+C Gram-positive bacteria)]ELB95071.1 site-specific recombinase [Rhodococcus wratislaviensis IFP 2016]